MQPLVAAIGAEDEMSGTFSIDTFQHVMIPLGAVHGAELE